jgi:hypothetical protein
MGSLKAVMTYQLLPQRADNTYRGHKLALALFGLLLLMKAGISLGSIFNGHNAASSADGIPIDTYTPAGARTVLSLFALLGVSNFLICVIGAVVLVRYRSLIPFMFTLLLLQQLSRQLVLQFLPIARTGTPPGSAINVVILIVMIAGLALSLWRRDNPEPVSALEARPSRST